MKALTQAAIDEVYACHVRIESWFHGQEDATPALLTTLLGKFAPSFSMVNPGGVALTYDDLQQFLAGMRGARPSVRIEVTPPVVVAESDDYCVLRYEELQHMDDSLLHRTSTAVFATDENGGARWIHLHETWMPERE